MYTPFPLRYKRHNAGKIVLLLLKNIKNTVVKSVNKSQNTGMYEYNGMLLGLFVRKCTHPSLQIETNVYAAIQYAMTLVCYHGTLNRSMNVTVVHC